MCKKNIISLSGKKGSGKDLVASLIQDLTKPSVDEVKNRGIIISPWEVRKFADKLKDNVCSLINCTRKDLESQEFKNTPLGEEYNRYFLITGGNGTHKAEFPSYDEAINAAVELYNDDVDLDLKVITEEMTPRKFLQVYGTECCRNLNKNIWVNALFSNFVPNKPIAHSGVWSDENCYLHKFCAICSESFYGYKRQMACKSCIDEGNWLPMWIITDTRFPNEIGAIEKRKGLKLKVIRKKTSQEWQEQVKDYIVVLDPDGWNRDHRYQKEWHEDKITLDEFQMKVLHSTYIIKDGYRDWLEALNHSSETSLDSYEHWDYVIINDGSIDDLRLKVKHILELENMI